MSIKAKLPMQKPIHKVPVRFMKNMNPCIISIIMTTQINKPQCCMMATH